MGKEKDAPQRRQRHTHLLAQRLARLLAKALRCYRIRVRRFRNKTPWLNGIRIDLSESSLGIHSSQKKEKNPSSVVGANPIERYSVLVMLLNVAPNLERRNSNDDETIDLRKKD